MKKKIIINFIFILLFLDFINLFSKELNGNTKIFSEAEILYNNKKYREAISKYDYLLGTSPKKEDKNIIEKRIYNSYSNLKNKKDKAKYLNKINEKDLLDIFKAKTKLIEKKLDFSNIIKNEKSEPLEKLVLPQKKQLYNDLLLNTNDIGDIFLTSNRKVFEDLTINEHYIDEDNGTQYYKIFKIDKKDENKQKINPTYIDVFPRDFNIFSVLSFNKGNDILLNHSSKDDIGGLYYPILSKYIYNEDLVYEEEKENIVGIDGVYSGMCITKDYKYLVYSFNDISKKQSELYMVKIKDEKKMILDKKKIKIKTNMKGSKKFPYVVNNNLYFTSDSEGGFGGYDFYLIEGFQQKVLKGEKIEPILLPEPINSKDDEYSIVDVSENGQKIYFFTSNRGESVNSKEFYRYHLGDNQNEVDFRLAGKSKDKIEISKLYRIIYESKLNISIKSKDNVIKNNYQINIYNSKGYLFSCIKGKEKEISLDIFPGRYIVYFEYNNKVSVYDLTILDKQTKQKDIFIDTDHDISIDDILRDISENKKSNNNFQKDPVTKQDSNYQRYPINQQSRDNQKNTITKQDRNYQRYPINQQSIDYQKNMITKQDRNYQRYPINQQSRDYQKNVITKQDRNYQRDPINQKNINYQENRGHFQKFYPENFFSYDIIKTYVITFSNNSPFIYEKNRNKIKKIINEIKNIEYYKIMIVGYSDVKETKEKLSEERAKEIYFHFLSKGIPENKILQQGNSVEIGGNTNNKRVEITVFK